MCFWSELHQAGQNSTAPEVIVWKAGSTRYALSAVGVAQSNSTAVGHKLFLSKRGHLAPTRCATSDSGHCDPTERGVTPPSQQE